MANENFTIKKNGNEYRMKIPFGFDARIENHEVVLTKQWTILDAESGDIIAYDDAALICLRMVAAGGVFSWAEYWDYPDNGEESGRCQKFCYGEPGCIDSVSGGPFRPATEEERKRFFEKMDEAGFEWDGKRRKPKPKGEEEISVSVKE